MNNLYKFVKFSTANAAFDLISRPPAFLSLLNFPPMLCYSMIVCSEVYYETISNEFENILTWKLCEKYSQSIVKKRISEILKK